MKQMAQSVLADFKLIFREPSLFGFLAFPLLLLALVVYCLPVLMAKYPNLSSFTDLIIMVATIENTQAFCFIYTMVFIDEQEHRVSVVYGITPVNKIWLLFVRLLIPFLVTVLLNLVLLGTQPFFGFGWGQITAIACLTAMIVPIYVMSINLVAHNWVEGLAYIKGGNILVLLPLIAYFLPGQYHYLMALLPTFWVFEGIFLAMQNLSVAMPIFVGSVVMAILVLGVGRIFINRYFQAR